MSASEKMNLSSMRKTIAVAASAVVILAATWASAAAATKAAGTKPELGTGGLASAVSGVANSSMISAMPAYCCPSYSPGGAQGLTTYGQASVKGQGTAARDAAITKAIADATEQAKVAAAAAGLTLGKIVDMQVSAPYFAYAGGIAVSNGMATASGSAKGAPIPPSTGMETGMATGVASSGSGSSGGSVGISPDCPAGASCPVIMPNPMPVETFASVTITWAIS